MEPTENFCAPIIRMSTGGGMPIDGTGFATAGVAGDTNEMVCGNDPPLNLCDLGETPF